MDSEPVMKEVVVSQERNEEGFPILEAVRVSDRSERFVVRQCPYCARRHVHGATEGHRIPHCYPPEKAPDTGYTLREVI